MKGNGLTPIGVDEAAKVHRGSASASLSTDPASVEATIGQLTSEDHRVRLALP